MTGTEQATPPSTSETSAPASLRPKTAFERAREAEDAKRRREEEETRAAYEDFVRSFQDDSQSTVDFVGSGGSGYRAGEQSRFVPPKRKLNSSSFEPADRSEDDSSNLPKRRQLDAPLLRPDQARMNRLFSTDAEAAQETARREDQIALAARTLSLGCVPSDATAEFVRQIFSSSGVGTVEQVILQPAAADGEPRKTRGRTVSVVLRNAEEVERCRTTLDGKYLGRGYWLQAWIGRNAGLSSRLERTGLPFNAMELSSSRGDGGRRPPPSHGGSWAAGGGTWQKQAYVHVQYPSSLKDLRRIHAMVENVKKHGPEFEAAIMHRERMNPDFAFLFDCDLPEHVYYRWKLWSLCSGDGIETWDEKHTPTEIFRGRELWIPPIFTWTVEDELRRLDGEDMDDEEEAQKKLAASRGEPEWTPTWLGPTIRLHLTLLLQHISMRRGAIARVMAFAIDNAYAAEEIVDVICQSIVSKSASTQIRAARLWAVGDILYNSGMGVGGVAKGVWKYRTLFQTKLVEVFEGLNEVYRSFEGRIRADNFRRQIMSIISVWEGWNIFTHDAFTTMTNKFLGTEDKASESENAPPSAAVPVDKASSFRALANRWKKIDQQHREEKAEEPDKEKEEGAVGSDAGEGSVAIEDLIDPELDGEPMTDSDEEEEGEVEVIEQ
ncbi:hypothetical protein BZA70DRAFT_286088 [Myxozyma melibiosi]|uniref:CID domain-containing protein n=1 Tax=Myxozyma melibiosi TaxID=54550 RepID=A0ABR1EXR6_9ASCO